MGVFDISPPVFQGVQLDSVSARDGLAALLLKAFGGILLVGVVKFWYHLHQTRMHVRKVRDQYGIVSYRQPRDRELTF